MRRILIYGPPGTGKTTRLLELMEQHIAAGVDPRRIAFLTFTRRARAEALERVGKQFALGKRELPYFRTIHSVAYKELHLKDGDLMTEESLAEFGKLMGCEFSKAAAGEQAAEGLSGKQGDALLAMDNLARLRGVPIQTVWRAARPDIEWPTVQQFCDSYAHYKASTGLMDFTDVLSAFAHSRLRLPVDVAFIDEAQDLSALQWQAALQSTEGALQYIAGDDDQAIYKWAGAEVELFIRLPGERTVLHQSHRLPRTVHALAAQLAQRIRARVPKQFAARDAEGLIARHAGAEALPVGNGAQWLWLARNRYLLPPLRQQLERTGVVYAEHGMSSIRDSDREAIYDWERLRAGKQVEAQRCRGLYQYLRSGAQVARGHKALPGVPDDLPMTDAVLRAQHGLLAEGPWYDVLGNINDNRKSYYRSLLAHHKTLRLQPTVQLDTIHGSKGAQADCVALFTDTSRRVWEERATDPDSEHRVWYVGATRAREQLHIVEPQGRWHYEL